MSLDSDAVVVRRRLRRKLTFWRVFTVLALIVAVGFVAARIAAPGETGLTQHVSPFIARVKIQGLILCESATLPALV